MPPPTSASRSPPPPALRFRHVAARSHSSPSAPIHDLLRGRQFRGTFLTSRPGDIIKESQQEEGPLNEFLLAWPDGVQRYFPAAADVDGNVRFVRHAELASRPARLLDRFERATVILWIAPDDDEGAAVRSGSPQPVVVVRRDHWRKRIFIAKQLERACLAVVEDERTRGWLLLVGKRLIDRRHLARKIFPAEHVSEVLRKRAERVTFS